MASVVARTFNGGLRAEPLVRGINAPKAESVLATSRSLLNIKVIGQGHMVFCFFLCVHDTAATRLTFVLELLVLGPSVWANEMFSYGTVQYA